jgi:4-amino-4-deoxy-L-arabinose transferase-like glycosyltransferase
MLMTSLVILTTVWASKHNNSKTLTLAAISAGLAAAAKYPGGITLFLPLYVALKGEHKFQRLGIVITFFVLTFLFITPGILLEPVEFIKNVRGEMNHYKTGHAAHTLETKLDGIHKISEFILFRLFSSDAAISLLVILLAVLGSVFIWRQNKNYAYIILFPLISYLLYFSTQKVFFVRNLLMLTPFIVILVGISINSLMKYLNGNVLRFAIPTAFLALLSINLNDYFKAVDSLQNPHQDAWGMVLEQYLDKNTNKKISISEKALTFISDSYKNTHSDLIPREAADIYIFTLKEELWICANQRNSFQVLAGPDDIDLDYYPEWVGYNRLVALDQHVCH